MFSDPHPALAKIECTNYPPPFEGKCHCGNVQFRVNKLAPGGLRTGYLCDCSLCVLRGAVTVFVPLDGLEVLRGKDALTLYKFNTGVANHFFCSKCGIYTFHQCRSDAGLYAVNVACLRGLSPFCYAEVPVLDANAKHPEDDAAGPEQWCWKGVIRFVPQQK